MHEVKVLRKAVNMKQYVLAQQLGLDQSNYANMENGKLFTNKLPEIKQKAVKIILPLLKQKVDKIKLDLQSTEELVKRFENDGGQYNITLQLPDFLYESDGNIHIGYKADEICTDEWREWLKDNLR